jgi:hypothetical protein
MARSASLLIHSLCAPSSAQGELTMESRSSDNDQPTSYGIVGFAFAMLAAAIGLLMYF